MAQPKNRHTEAVGMERADELCTGKVCVLGEKRSVAAIMNALLEECSVDVPTVVLCHDPAIAERSARKEDAVVVMGDRPEAGERFPELLEPWLHSPEFGGNLDSLVDALSAKLTDDLPVLTSNDAFWSAGALRLYNATLRACLLGMKWTRSFSLTDFARFHEEIWKAFPAMVENDPGKNTYDYPRHYAWVKAFKALEEEIPFTGLLADVHVSTAQITMNTCYSLTGGFRDLLKKIPKEHEGGESFLSFCDYLKDHRGGRLFLVLPRRMKSVAPALFRFLLAGLEIAHLNCGEPDARLIIPDVSAWREPASLNALLREGPESLSVIWGASNLIQLNTLGKSKTNIAQSMVMFSETRVWARSGDPAAEEIYRMLIPASRRLYSLAEIPRSQCFIESPFEDFAGVAIPPLPELRSKNAEGEGGGSAQTSILWIDAPERGFPETDTGEEESSFSDSEYFSGDCPPF